MAKNEKSSSPICFNGMQYRIDSGNVLVITKYTGHEANVIIPSEINGISVTKIGYRAFYDCFDVKNVTLPESICEIGGGAFERCNNLKSIVIPESVCVIEQNAFLNCKSLEMVTILKKNCQIVDAHIGYDYFNNPEKYRTTICNNCQSFGEEYHPWGGLVEILETEYNGVIQGYPGSTAEEYAKNYCKFKTIN